MELKITERGATLEVVALTDFELETLARLKHRLPEMIPSLEVTEKDGMYWHDGALPKDARISIDFLPPKPSIPMCPTDSDITDSLHQFTK